MLDIFWFRFLQKLGKLFGIKIKLARWTQDSLKKQTWHFLGHFLFCWIMNTLFMFHGFAPQELCERDRKWQFSCWLVYFSNTTSQLSHFYKNALNNVYFSIWRFHISQTQPHTFVISTQTILGICIFNFVEFIIYIPQTQPQNLKFHSKF